MKGELFDPRFGVRDVVVGNGPSRWPAYGFLLALNWYMVYLLPFMSHLAGSIRPSDSDTMTNTASEAIASSSGKNVETDSEAICVSGPANTKP